MSYSFLYSFLFFVFIFLSHTFGIRFCSFIFFFLFSYPWPHSSFFFIISIFLSHSSNRDCPVPSDTRRDPLSTTSPWQPSRISIFFFSIFFIHFWRAFFPSYVYLRFLSHLFFCVFFIFLIFGSIKNIIKDFDANKDGKVSLEEFINAIEKVFSSSPPPPPPPGPLFLEIKLWVPSIPMSSTSLEIHHTNFDLRFSLFFPKKSPS